MAYIPVAIWLIYRAGGDQALAAYGVLLTVAVVVVYLIRRSHRRQDELLSNSLTDSVGLKKRDSENVRPAVRDYLEDRARILACLVTRAAREINIKNERIPLGSEMVTRQSQMEYLRRCALWRRLESDEANLFIAPEGAWTAEQPIEIIGWCEQLRLLRWVLRIDSELTPLAHFPQVEVSMAQDLLETRSALVAGRSILRSWDVRIERDMAMEYVARAIAEMKGRGLIDNSGDLHGWVDELRQGKLGPSTDLLVGPTTVGDLSENNVRLMAHIAAARARYATYLVEQLSSDNPIPFGQWNEQTAYGEAQEEPPPLGSTASPPPRSST